MFSALAKTGDFGRLAADGLKAATCRSENLTGLGDSRFGLAGLLTDIARDARGATPEVLAGLKGIREVLSSAIEAEGKASPTPTANATLIQTTPTIDKPVTLSNVAVPIKGGPGPTGMG